MTFPLVSVITPTWQRHDLLLSRCIPSVQAQTYPDVEHVIVSDSPDPELAELLSGLDVRYGEVPGPPGHWGHAARLAGTGIARGDLICWLDDDDAYRPDHVTILAGLLAENPAADFAYSRMMSHAPGGVGSVIGGDPPYYGGIGTPMIMHRRALLGTATWELSLPSIDWDLVERWLAAGAAYVSVPDITVDVWPSAWHS